MNTIDELRTRIARAKADREAVLAQARGREDVRTLVTDAVEALAAEARLRADRALARVSTGDSPRLAVLSVFGSSGDRPVDPAGLVALLSADAVAAVLLARIDSVPEGLTAADRAERLADLATEIDQLEHAEERAIVEADRAGTPIARRDDARIDVILAATAPARAPTRKTARVAAPVDVVEGVAAEAADRALRRAREGLQATPAKSAYLQRSKGNE